MQADWQAVPQDSCAGSRSGLPRATASHMWSQRDDIIACRGRGLPWHQRGCANLDSKKAATKRGSVRVDDKIKKGRGLAHVLP